MSEHVLVPVDGSAPSRAALEYTLDRFPDGRLTALYVVDPMADYSRQRAFPGYTADDEYLNEREKGEAILDSLRERISDDSFETVLEVGKPGRTIVAYAEDHDADGIVVDNHSRDGAARYLLGSVAELVVRRADVPVTVVRGSD
ncbi:universal stress protein [Natrarchaeobius oligotrophus]|uniref:Universal stress protein n=1 Tax=Natrarchaeobius chitinivorans TaxID=1679083 RepID=A0A3N6NI24_NATCH|nr:universal stress protein [Natrarchaeobius chitinivorans]RQG98782.1 universal stress protein [Natrarchaeobius chitinivorans]